jgi:mannose-6-phosphate isomerase-like protein (cupin superfamily)
MKTTTTTNPELLHNQQSISLYIVSLVFTFTNLFMLAEVAPLLSGNVAGWPGNDFIVAEWQDAGGPPGPPRYIAPLHVHHGDDEAWYVLEGMLCVRVGDKIIEAAAGSCVFVPKGTPHTYWNPTQDRTRYLLIMTPSIYNLVKDIHADHSPEKLKEVFARYNSEILADGGVK